MELTLMEVFMDIVLKMCTRICRTAWEGIVYLWGKNEWRIHMGNHELACLQDRLGRLVNQACDQMSRLIVFKYFLNHANNIEENYSPLPLVLNWRWWCLLKAEFWYITTMKKLCLWEHVWGDRQASLRVWNQWRSVILLRLLCTQS